MDIPRPRILGSVLFLVWQAAVTVAFSMLALLIFPAPRRFRHRVIGWWNPLVIHGARVLCGIRWETKGLDRLPEPPFVLVSNHQSAWETMGFHLIFPPHVYVMKRELLFIPFFGWGVACMSPITIDRSRPRAALARLGRVGKERIAQGFSVVIFPEGTRKPVGSRGRHSSGGAWLAKSLGVALVPVAINSGLCWPRQAWLKRPGRVTVSVGEALEAGEGTPDELAGRARAWIQEEQARLEGPAAAAGTRA